MGVNQQTEQWSRSYALSRFRMACTSVSSPLSGSDLGAG